MLPKSHQGKQISFGQGPRPEASINPSIGQPGTIFHCNAVKFDPCVKVQIEIVDCQERSIYHKILATSESGSIGGIAWEAEPDLPVGQYRLLITGKCESRIETISKDFNLVP